MKNYAPNNVVKVMKGGHGNINCIFSMLNQQLCLV